MLIAGNWKLFKGPAETSEFCAELRRQVVADGVDVVVCVPFVSLAAAVAALDGSGIRVFAQNAHWQETGPYTGEVAPGMLAELGVAGTIVGHSERRVMFGETDETAARRAAHALASGLDVIACVGELEAERDDEETEAVLQRQVGAIVEAAGDSPSLTVAYEPVWAIGTGRTATPEQAQSAHAYIRSLLDVPILYGGSVKPENAAVLLGESDVDGALVGGASLEVDSFVAICEAARAAAE
jgi:triosephosphate isomerase